eukprot:gb/GECH01010956.1/.p1 GENE.gb/GECH01010956.1/~~gb/GECH01010956.1/.p1  ORF type:complete len:303 (+),score=106.69 gb/GECH01010956.1/:1-909(+)
MRFTGLVLLSLLFILLVTIPQSFSKDLGGGIFLKEGFVEKRLKQLEQEAFYLSECDCEKIWQKEDPSCKRWASSASSESQGAQDEGSRGASSETTSSTQNTTETTTPVSPSTGDGNPCGILCLILVSGGSFILFTACGLICLAVFLKFRLRRKGRGFNVEDLKDIGKSGVTEEDFNDYQGDIETSGDATESYYTYTEVSDDESEGEQYYEYYEYENEQYQKEELEEYTEASENDNKEEIGEEEEEKDDDEELISEEENDMKAENEKEDENSEQIEEEEEEGVELKSEDEMDNENNSITTNEE